jgi:aryl-alcohol dehydrogenase-like predicted oxidoreductase
MGDFMSEETLKRVQSLKPIAQEHGLTLAQLSLAWVLRNSNVASAIVGASRPEQISENLKAVGVKLAPEVMKRIDEITCPVSSFDAGLTKSPPTRVV